MQQTVQQTLRSARAIAGSLAAGVVLFWIVAWMSTRGVQPESVPESSLLEHASWLWLVVAFLGFSGALFFRNRALRVVEDFLRDGEGPTNEMVVAVQRNLSIAWMLLEGPALLSGVLYLIAMIQVLSIAAPLYFIGFVLTFPRAEWFGVRPARMRRW